MSKSISNGLSVDIPVQATHSLKLAWLGGTYTAQIISGAANVPVALATNSASDQTFGPYATAIMVRLTVSAIGRVAWDTASAPAFIPPGEQFTRQDDGIPVTLSGVGPAAAFAVDGGGNIPGGGSSVVKAESLFDPSSWTKEANPIFLQANSSFSTIYWPWVVKASDHVATPLNSYYLFYSTDHDATLGGIGMAHGPSPLGPWVNYGLVYRDTASQTAGLGQTETPSVVWDAYAQNYRMFYQNSAAKYGASNSLNAVGAQSTLSATSTDLLTWTKDPNFINDIPAVNAQHGDGHTGYFTPFQNGGEWNAYSLYGGTNGGDFVLWRSDGQMQNWYTDAKPLGYSLDLMQGAPLNARHTAWNSSFVINVGGQKVWIGRLSSFASGTTAADCLIGIAPISDNLRTLLARPTVIWSPTLGWESADQRSVVPFVDGNRLYVYYAIAKQSFGVISHAI